MRDYEAERAASREQRHSFGSSASCAARSVYSCSCLSFNILTRT
jgi:hypothetical protein